MNRKVVLILADGMRPDAMKSLPYAKKLMAESAYTMKARTVFPSVTLPCHMSLFLGVPPERHGITTNLYMPPVRPVDGILEQLKAANKTSAVYYDWEPLRDLWRPGSVNHAVFCKENYEVSDELNTADLIEYMSTHSPDFVFLYLGFPDDAGHGFGWMSDEYMRAVKCAWTHIEHIVEKYRDEYTFIITADHGGHDRNHGTQLTEDMTIPLILSGPDFTPGEITREVSIMDITPTITKLMEANPSPEWEGNPLI